MNQNRRDFFKSVLGAGAALAAVGTGSQAEAAGPQLNTECHVKGLCLFVPSLGKASEFVEMMNRQAPGNWQVHPLKGSITDCYFTTIRLYGEARGEANTFVGVVDPATFAVVHEAIVDAGGGFHYARQEKDRVTFSALI